MNDRERIVERIKKIMAKTRKDANAPEAELDTALKMARKLMDEFNVSEKDIAEPENVDARKRAYDDIAEQQVYSRAGQILPFDVDLASIIAYLCDVGIYLTEAWVAPENELNKARGHRKGCSQKRQFIVFYGMTADRAVACMLFKEILITVRTIFTAKYGRDVKKRPDYQGGFNDRLRERVWEIKRRGQAEAGTTAIVLAKDTIVKKWAEDKLNLTRAKPRKSRRDEDPDAYLSGREDANDISLETNQVPDKSGKKSRELESK